MRITPDLRTPDFVRSEEKRQDFNWNRFYFTIMFGAFAALSAFCTIKVQARLWTLDAATAKIKGETHALSGEIAALERDISSLAGKEILYRRLLNAMRREPLLVEALFVIGRAVPKDAHVESLRFTESVQKVTDSDHPSGVPSVETEYDMEMTVIVKDEKQIVAINSALAGSGLFESIAMPNSRREERTNEVDVRMNARLRPFRSGALLLSSGSFRDAVPLPRRMADHGKGER